MPIEKIPLTKRRIDFLETYSDLDDSQTLKELLFASTLQVEKLEKIRSNTSVLVWWLIAIPLLMFLFLFLFGGLSLM